MATIRDRVTAGLSDIGDTIARVAGAIRRPQIAPSAHVPGIPQWAGGAPANRSEALIREIMTPEGYFGKISYDAGPSWTRFSSYPANDLTPEKIVGAQQEAVAGWPLRWSEMVEQVWDRDSHLSGIGQQRIDDVVKGSWRLQRAAPDDVAACVRNFCDEQLRDLDSMEEADGWLLMSNAYSYSSVEIVWRPATLTFPAPNGKIIGPIRAVVPSRLEPVHAKHFRFDMRTDEPLLWIGSDQLSLPYGKFIFAKGEGGHPITERRGYMRACVWLSMIRSVGIAGWASWVERYGMPTPLLEYDGDVTQYREHKAAYEDILKMLGQGIGAIVPSQNFKLEFAKPSDGGRASDPHSALADACDSAQSIRVLGATLTAKISNSGSFAASSNHTEVKYNKEEHDARRLWTSKRRDLLAPLVRFNARELARAISEAGYQCTPDMIVRRVPRGMQRVPRDSGIVEQQGVVTAAINEWGLPVSRESLYDRFDLSAPISDDDVASGKPQQVTAGGKVVSTIEATTEGAEAPKENPEAGSTNSDEGGAKDPTPDDKVAHIDLAPTDVASIVTVNQALRSQGLPPISGEDGSLTITEFKAKRSAVIAKASSAERGDHTESEPTGLDRTTRKRKRKTNEDTTP